MLRWQISTPIIGLCYALWTDCLGIVWTAILANIVGGLVFFVPDLYIFNGRKNGDRKKMVGKRL